MAIPPLHDKIVQMILENQGIIHKICNSYCNNKSDREDLAQEIMYQLWKSANSFKEEYKFSTWMYRIALNVAISFYRKEKKNNDIIPLSENASDIEDDAHGSVDMEENINLLQQFIHELKSIDKALMLLYLEAKSYSEIAEIMGISETNVATKISRIKDKLKQNFYALNK
jgi:RNA polymerase sigma-70 factor (ECF subfamily)